MAVCYSLEFNRDSKARTATDAGRRKKRERAQKRTDERRNDERRITRHSGELPLSCGFHRSVFIGFVLFCARSRRFLYDLLR
jgi:hypothetical protein